MEPQSFDFDDANQLSLLINQQRNQQNVALSNKFRKQLKNVQKLHEQNRVQPKSNLKIEEQQNIKHESQQILQFPNLQQIKSIHFKDKKQIKAYVNSYPQDFYYKVIALNSVKNQKIWLKCSFEKCQSTLVFEWSQQKMHFILKYSQIKHTHANEKQKMAYLQKQIKQFMEQKGLFRITNQIRRKYGLGNRRFRMLKQKLNFQGKAKQEQIQVEVKKQGGVVRKSRIRECSNQNINYIQIDERQNSYPKTVIIYDKLMQRLCQKNHDVIYLQQFDVQIKYEQQGVSKKLVFLSGIDQNNFIVLFAGILTDNDPTFVIQGINRFFTEIALVKVPQSIITRDQPFLTEVVSGMQDLQEYSQLSHFLDRNQYFESVKKSISQNYSNNNPPLKNTSELLITYEQKRVRSILKDYQKMKEHKAIQFFQHYNQKVCNYSMNRSFYGLECAVPSKAFWNRYICYRIKRQQFNLRMFGSILCYFNWRKQNQYQIFIAPRELTQHYNDKFLQEVRVRLNEPVFNRFLEEYQESSSMKIKKIDAGVFKVDRFWQVINFWCVCSARRHSGIPCCHQLAVCRELNVSYLPFINKRWLLDKTVKTLQENQIQIQTQRIQTNQKVKKQTMKLQEAADNQNEHAVKNLRFKLQQEIQIPSFDFY